MKKSEKILLCIILCFGLLALIIALSMAVIKVKKENKELEERFSSTLASESKARQKEEKILSDKNRAADLVKNFISVYFLMDKDNRVASLEKVKEMVSDEIYNQIKDEEFEVSEYTVEIVSAPVYEIAGEEKSSRYFFTSIINLQYKAGMKDYGMHMQIWNFTCGNSGDEMQILDMKQQEYIE